MVTTLGNKQKFTGSLCSDLAKSESSWALGKAQKQCTKVTAQDIRLGKLDYKEVIPLLSFQMYNGVDFLCLTKPS
jgi:hypothetical protein